MNKEATIDSKKAQEVIGACFKQSLKMENLIFRTMIDILLQYCPDKTFNSCFNTAIIQLTEKNK